MGEGKVDFGTIQCCDISSLNSFFFSVLLQRSQIILKARPLPYVHSLILSHSWSFDYIQ